MVFVPKPHQTLTTVLSGHRCNVFSGCSHHPIWTMSAGLLQTQFDFLVRAKNVYMQVLEIWVYTAALCGSFSHAKVWALWGEAGVLGLGNREVDCKRLVSDIKPTKSSISGEQTFFQAAGSWTFHWFDIQHNKVCWVSNIDVGVSAGQQSIKLADYHQRKGERWSWWTVKWSLAQCLLNKGQGFARNRSKGLLTWPPLLKCLHVK